MRTPSRRPRSAGLTGVVATLLLLAGALGGCDRGAEDASKVPRAESVPAGATSPVAGAAPGGQAPPAAAAAAVNPGAPPPARRIVSLAPSLTEILFALGAGEQVVGVTRFCDRPAEARTRPAVGDAIQVSLEQVVALAPDLILVNALGTADAVAPLKDRVRILRVPTDTLAQLPEAVATHGREAGRDAAADDLRARIAAALDAARTAARGRPRTRVLFVVQREPFYVAGRGSFVQGFFEVLGLENAMGDLPEAWPCVSAEALLASAPDALVDASLGPGAVRAAGDADCLAWWSRFPGIPAVQRRRVRALADESALRPGTGVAAALAAIEAAVAPAPEGNAREPGAAPPPASGAIPTPAGPPERAQ
ncbi:MAG: ABC transporter substrate-binding protein [Planctomycetes bacterium]|nr:ABC transporter substrate-binding protein [Planctomycetota bacterium]